MRKIALFVAIMTAMLLIFAACAPMEPSASEPAESSQEPPATSSAAPETSVAESVEPEGPVNPNEADYTYVEDPGTVFDLNEYYGSVGVTCDVSIRSTGGTVKVPDDMTTPLPTANEKYTIGFSVYYTVDEVGSMILETMQSAAETCGVELLVNDANYDQNAQNQAIEQWILQGVDGVILAPCDFTGVKATLDALEAAEIPVVTLNAPLAGNIDACVISECVEQGNIAGQMLEEALLAAGTEMSGTIVWQTLPFVHPNAETRALGFAQVFEAYPDIELVPLTGTSPEDHYTAFEGALNTHPDMLGAWGLYSSATIGMMNAKASAGSDVLLTSIDNDKPILKGIYDGDILGSACYSSIAPANWCMSEMVNLLNGIDIPGVVMYANMKVTADNVAEAFEHYYPGQTLEGYIAGS